MRSFNDHLHDFIQGVCKQIRFKSVHPHVIKELTDHIEDQKQEYIEGGMDEEAAGIKAVQQMGDAVMVGQQLDKAHRPRTEWSILSISAMLVVFGAIYLYILSGVSEYTNDIFSAFLQYAPIGILIFAVTYFFDYSWLARHYKLATSLIFLLSIGGFLFLGTTYGIFTHVYYSTLLFIPLLAGIVYSMRNKRYWGIVFSSLFYAIAAIQCLIAPSFASLLLLTISYLVILTAAIVKGFFRVNIKRGLALVYAPMVALAGVVIWIIIRLFSERTERVIAAFYPEQYPDSSGYLILLIRRLITNAEPFGAIVLTENTTLDRLLPMWSTNLSLTYFIARFGYVPGLIVVGILIILMIRMFIAVYKQKNNYGFILSLSAYLALTGQIIIFILINIGMLLPMDVILPFISYGAVGYMINMGLMGLLLSVYRRTDMVYEMK